MTVPTSKRSVKVHVLGNDGSFVARQDVTLGALAWRCLQGDCVTGAKVYGWPCPVANGRPCSKVTPEAWAQYLRLHELDRLGR